MARNDKKTAGRSTSNGEAGRSKDLFKTQILPALIAAILAFVAGFFMSQKTSNNISTTTITNNIPPNKSKSSKSSTKSKAVSVLNVSHLPNAYEGALLDKVATSMETRLEKLLEGTYTEECRTLIRDSFGDYLLKNIQEEYLPFEKETIQSECKPKAPRVAPVMVPADEIRLVYLLLVHEQPEQIIRTIEALNEPQHHFLVHIDAKSQETFEILSTYASDKHNIHIMGNEYRMNVNWGGFNVVQGTLNGMFHVIHELKLEFHWLITVSGYTYPLMSNNDIRARLSNYPLDTNFFEISPQPNKPAPRTWHHFVECDNAMRRIWRLPELRGISMYAGSQWFMASKDFVKYVSVAAGAGWTKQFREARGGGAIFKDNFASKYAVYGKHTMIADENYFSTVLKASHFCNTHENNNQVHVQFDQYEHEKTTHKALPSANKCLMPNPNHCGRSPTITTLDYLPVLDLGDKLFARKFVSKVDSQVLDAIDHMRSIDRLDGARPPKSIHGLSSTLPSKQTLNNNKMIGNNKKSKEMIGNEEQVEVEEEGNTCIDNNPQCRGWAAMGECKKNPKYMNKKCPFSCDVCPVQNKKKIQIEKVQENVEKDVTQDIEQKDSHSSIESLTNKVPNELHNFVLAISLSDGLLTDSSSLRNDDNQNDFGMGWEGLYCIQGYKGRGMQGSVKLVPCNPLKHTGQVFHSSPCSKDGILLHDNDKGILNAEKGLFNPPFCNIYTESVRMCLDVEREQVKEGSKIITWPCHNTKWNQLFSFNGNYGHIFINIPYIQHLDKLMCIQASSKRSPDIRLAPCDSSNSLQHFLFYDAESSPIF